MRSVSGGDKRDRTADLLNAIQALSQLSYTPNLNLMFKKWLFLSIYRILCTYQTDPLGSHGQPPAESPEKRPSQILYDS